MNNEKLYEFMQKMYDEMKQGFIEAKEERQRYC